MPNWCEGVLKVRGTKEDIINFLKNGLEPINPAKQIALITGKEYKEIEVKAELDDYEFTLEASNGFYLKNSSRAFVETRCIEFYFGDDKEESESHTLSIPNFKQAWGIEAKTLAEHSKVYNLDFKIFAFECGMEFNQDIEIHKGEIIKDNEITYDDYVWECVMPDMGG
ncbi:hypothetical protein LG275_03850 [Chryseomicrobium palamuruense]